MFSRHESLYRQPAWHFFFRAAVPSRFYSLTTVWRRSVYALIGEIRLLPGNIASPLLQPCYIHLDLSPRGYHDGDIRSRLPGCWRDG